MSISLSTLTIRVRNEEIDKALMNVKNSEGFLKKFNEKAANIVFNVMRSLAPIGKTGHLRGTIQKYIADWGFQVYPTAYYAIFLEHGTGMFGRKHHLIFPRQRGRLTKKALKFEIGGKTIFAKYVIGTPDIHFVQRTRELTREPVLALAKEMVEEQYQVV